MDAGPVAERRRLTVAAEGRLDAVLAELSSDLSRARVQRLIAAGNVRVNGSPARKSVRVVPGDELEITIEHERPGAPTPTFDMAVLYEDDEIVAVDKPAGLVVHGGPGEAGQTVAAWFASRYAGAAAAFDAERPGIVHRLDRDTSGVLVLAKTPVAQAALSAAFESRDVAKTYLAVTDAVPAKREAVIDAPIGRHPADRTRMAVVRRGRPARTGYEVLGADSGRALLRLALYTGRTHQARVHLAAIGAPIVNDAVHGRAGDGRQLLHAWRIDLPHPAGGRLEVTSPLPEDMAAAIRGMGLGALALEFATPVPARRTPPAEPGRS